MKKTGKIKIGINGFGRIGRAIAKINTLTPQFELVAINDINPHIDNLAYLLKYDSTYGRFPGVVENNSNSISINNSTAKCYSSASIMGVDWDEKEVDIVIDSSGVASNIHDAKELIRTTSVKKVVVTHSNDNVDKEVIMGVNDEQLEANHHVVSNSICDANAIAHVLKWIDDAYGIKGGSLTTLHPWLSYQNLVDGPAISQSTPGVVWKDYALGRASTDALIPKNTTAMTATEKVLPNLTGKITSFSFRIPTDIVACSDITLFLNQTPTQNDLFHFIEHQISESQYVKGNLASLVSLDYEMEEASAIVDLQWLKVENDVIKIILWYDNEWGYSTRALDLANAVAKFI